MTLEDLFFSFTEGDGTARGRAARRPRAAAPRRSLAPGGRDRVPLGADQLRHQKRTYLGLGAAALVPILFVVAIHFRHRRGGGGDFAFSSY